MAEWPEKSDKVAICRAENYYFLKKLRAEKRSAPCADVRARISSSKAVKMAKGRAQKSHAPIKDGLERRVPRPQSGLGVEVDGACVTRGPTDVDLAWMWVQ